MEITFVNLPIFRRVRAENVSVGDILLSAESGKNFLCVGVVTSVLTVISDEYSAQTDLTVMRPGGAYPSVFSLAGSSQVFVYHIDKRPVETDRGKPNAG